MSAVRREFLLAAIVDTEGTIRATDSKASMALVVQAFAFAGVLAVTGDVGARIDDASSAFRAVVIILLGAGAIAFVASVVQLARCVLPAPPRSLPDLQAATGRFFIRGSSHWATGRPKLSSFEEYWTGYEAASDIELERELAAELTMVSAIRVRKLALLKNGIYILGTQLLLIVVYLGTLGFQSLAS